MFKSFTSPLKLFGKNKDKQLQQHQNLWNDLLEEKTSTYDDINHMEDDDQCVLECDQNDNEKEYEDQEMKEQELKPVDGGDNEKILKQHHTGKIKSKNNEYATSASKEIQKNDEGKDIQKNTRNRHSISLSSVIPSLWKSALSSRFLDEEVSEERKMNSELISKSKNKPHTRLSQQLKDTLDTLLVPKLPSISPPSPSPLLASLETANTIKSNDDRKTSVWKKKGKIGTGDIHDPTCRQAKKFSKKKGANQFADLFRISKKSHKSSSSRKNSSKKANGDCTTDNNNDIENTSSTHSKNQSNVQNNFGRKSRNTKLGDPNGIKDLKKQLLQELKQKGSHNYSAGIATLNQVIKDRRLNKMYHDYLVQHKVYKHQARFLYFFHILAKYESLKADQFIERERKALRIIRQCIEAGSKSEIEGMKNFHSIKQRIVKQFVHCEKRKLTSTANTSYETCCNDDDDAGIYKQNENCGHETGEQCQSNRDHNGELLHSEESNEHLSLLGEHHENVHMSEEQFLVRIVPMNMFEELKQVISACLLTTTLLMFLES